MARFRQHGKASTLRHCEHVARKSWKLDQTFRLHSDRRALVRGAMLHDFYLYDWHVQDGTHRWHGFHHPERAVKNASRYIGISEKEAEIIRCHMWPLTLFHAPSSREAWIVCIADKLCSLEESLFRR